MAYTNLNDYLNPQEASNLEGNPFTGMYNQAMSGINPIDRITMNREAALRGQQMAEEALKQSQQTSQRGGLDIQRMQAELPQYAPTALLKAQQAQRDMRLMPGQETEAAFTQGIRNAPDYQDLIRDQMLSKARAEGMKSDEEVLRSGGMFPVNIGGQDIGLSPQDYVKYQNALADRAVREQTANKPPSGAFKPPTDQERGIQRLAEIDPEFDTNPAGAYARATSEYLRRKTQTPEKLESTETTRGNAIWYEANKLKLLSLMGKKPKDLTPEDKAVIAEAQQRGLGTGGVPLSSGAGARPTTAQAAPQQQAPTGMPKAGEMVTIGGVNYRSNGNGTVTDPASGKTFKLK